ncbi:Uncharacterized protein DAT39_013957, partial [Clarias magur]
RPLAAPRLELKKIPSSHSGQPEQQESHQQYTHSSVTHLPPALDCDLKLHLVSVEALSRGNIRGLDIPGVQQNT